MVTVPRPTSPSVKPEPRRAPRVSAQAVEHAVIEWRRVERPAITRSTALTPEEVQEFLDTMETGDAVYGRFANLAELKRARYLLYQKANQRGWAFRSRINFETCEMHAWAIQKAPKEEPRRKR